MSLPDPAASRLRNACAAVPCLSTSEKIRSSWYRYHMHSSNQKKPIDTVFITMCGTHTYQVRRKSPNGGLDFDLRSYEKIIWILRSRKLCETDTSTFSEGLDNNISVFIFFQWETKWKRIRVRIYQKPASRSGGKFGLYKRKFDFFFSEVALPDLVNPSCIKINWIQGKKLVVFISVVQNSVAGPGCLSRIPDPHQRI